MYDAIDCEGFAGGFTLGTVRAGFRLVGKRELPGGFGVASCEANRHLLGDDWVAEAVPWEEWTPYSVPFVFGNPPCSGFSLLSSQEFRGMDSSINDCMWALIHYAARCRPQFVVFESVQQAFKQGRPLMQALRQRLEEQTGTRYELFHVLHNAANVGGCAIRRRYFFVCAAMPFGLEPKLTTHVPTVMETIGDLTGLGNTIEPQPYRRPALSWWAKRKQAEDGAVCGHYTRTPPSAQRAYDLMNSIGWPPGEPISNVVRRYYQQHGRLPESWDDVKQEKLIASDFKMGFYQMHRWVADGPVRVVTGGAHLLVLHPTEPRLLTIREIARVQGFPDDWRIRELIRNDGFNKTAVVWGKGIPVECGQWIASWVRTALDGNPGTDTGKLTGDREHLIDYTAIDKAAMPLSLNGSRGG